MLAGHDKHYPSRSRQTSLATAVTKFTKPVTRLNSRPCIPVDCIEGRWFWTSSFSSLHGKHGGPPTGFLLHGCQNKKTRGTA